MNTIPPIEKPVDSDDLLAKPATSWAGPFQNLRVPPAVPRPAHQDATLIDDAQSLSDVMNAICDDCCKNSLHYVLRSDTGHDGE